jgi:hypothetical protein
MKVFGWVSAAIVGLVLGAGGAVYQLANATFGGENYGGWTGSKLTGSTAADPFTRARVAKAGLLALNRSETVYFTLTSDEHGRPLTQNCAYRLTGGAFPARWWSVTIYAADDFLPQNHDDAQSIDDTRVQKDPGGGWTAALQLQRPQAGGPPNWISTWAAGNKFSLTLRLYNPSPEAANDPSTIAFPQITTASCSGAAA